MLDAGSCYLKVSSSAAERCTEDRHVSISPAMLRSSNVLDAGTCYLKAAADATTAYEAI